MPLTAAGVLPSPDFILDKVELLLSRYSISYRPEEDRVEYFLADRRTGEEVSFELIFSLDRFARRIHVCKFHPGLYRLPDSKYLSAACFYLLVHHFGQYCRLEQEHTIFLQTRRSVYTTFYAALKDFDFLVRRDNQGENVDIQSRYVPAALDTSMIVAMPAFCSLA